MFTQPELPRSLSPEDRDLLRDALEAGYFQEPPQVTVAELAAAHDLSESATRRRLARGLSILLKTYRRSDEGAIPTGLLEEPSAWHP